MNNAFISALDNHNVANGDESWLTKKLDSLGETLSDIGQGVVMGAPIAVVAGVNSILNTGIAASNFVGKTTGFFAGDTEEISTYKVMQNLDDDFARYYKQNQEGIEIAGFVLGSFLPGMAGVKAVQAAKAGFMGTNMLQSSKLMRAMTHDYASAAKAEFAAGNNPFTLMNKNTLSAITQGFGSQALDAAAFEIAATTFLYKSPVLDEMDAGDLFKNMVTGVALGGGIGGVLHGVGLVHGIKKSKVAFDKEVFKYANIEEIGDNAPAELKLINYYNQKLRMPEVELSEKTASGLTVEKRTELLNTERQKTTDRLDVLIKQTWNTYAGGDVLLASKFDDMFKDAKNPDEILAALLHSKGTTRITENETLKFGDVLFLPASKDLKEEGFQAIKANGDWDMILSPKAGAGAQGYRVVGNLGELKAASAGVAENGVVFESKELAFAAGNDIFRNKNGSLSINPESTILKSSSLRRTENNVIVDFEKGGKIVEKALPGLADYSTMNKPVRVFGETVIAGDLKPINVNRKSSVNVIKDDYLETQARYVWASQVDNVRWEGRVVQEDDIALLELAYQKGDDAKGFMIKTQDGKKVVPPTGEAFREFLISKKKELAMKMDGASLEEISIRLNVSEDWLLGESTDFIKLKRGGDFVSPRYGKVNFADDLDALETLNANQILGATEYQRQIKLIQERHQQTFNNFARETADSFPEAPNWSDPNRIPTSEGAGASLFGFANADYGTAGAWAQIVGAAKRRLTTQRQTETAKTMGDALAPVAQVGAVAKAEVSLILNKLRSSPEAWKFHPTKTNVLITRTDYDGILKNKIQDASEEIVIQNQSVVELLETHRQLLASRQVHVKNLKGDAGLGDDFDPGVIYAPPINTATYKHFVLVKPRGNTLGDKTRVITAKDEETLSKLVGQVDKNEFRIVTKTDGEEWHKALGDYEYALGLNESLVDSSLKRKGVLSDFLPTTESDRVLDDLMDYHMRQDDLLVTKMVGHRYSQSFQELKHLGDRYTGLATSQFRSLTDKLADSVKDPYNDIVKTALDISRASEYQWWKGFNETVKDAIEAPVNSLRSIFNETKTLDDAFVDKVNKMSQNLGLGTPFRDAYAAMVANNNVADKPWLSKGIAKAQGILSTTLLQWDFFNGINNIVSTPILLSAEVQFLKNAIAASNPEVAGKLANLMSVKVPGQDMLMPSTNKLIRNALQNYRNDPNNELLKRYQSIGAVTDVLQQERQMLDDLSWTYKETPSEIDSKLTKASEAAKKWTGNKLAEEMTRFVSADVARQITDLAIEAGVLRNAKEANEYISLFVNKTQGNYLHSQRPIVFQGVVGQAASLFQTYQFNLMQQLFKYVGNGDGKSIAMLLGLQGSIYGMQGLPGFNFINTHIVGNAAGNTNHRDLYYASNTVFGKELGDWMLYGLGSNALGLIDPQLKMNLYTRGDINPRQATILPNSIEDIPVVSASVRFVGNLWNASEQIAKGGAFWPTLTQAVEHNGLSRPLAGLAQVVQGYTTTSQSSLLSASQDFWMISNLARVAGGKPFDEAVALDALYRINAYRAKDLSKIQDLGSALKTHLVGNNMPTEQDITDFAARYAKSGGRIENFNKFFSNAMTTANKSQVNAITKNLQNPFAQQMQVIMGGVPISDFQNQPQ